VCVATCADSIAYTFGGLGGLIKFTYGDVERPDTNVDRLTIGFRTAQSDALVAVVYSATSTDFVEVQLVSLRAPHPVTVGAVQLTSALNRYDR